MTSFFRWQFWRNRSRYWKKKCRDVEARYGLLLLQAEAEKWRNVAREDMFASAAAFQARGIVGIAPRVGPAAMLQQPKASVSPNPWDNVSGLEKMEFQEYYLRPGLEAGHSRQSIEAKFFADRAARRELNDEPTIG